MYGKGVRKEKFLNNFRGGEVVAPGEKFNGNKRTRESRGTRRCYWAQRVIPETWIGTH